MVLLTVRETIAALTLGSEDAPRLLAGAAGLEREVVWALGARPSPPLFPTIKGGELALATAAALARLDPPTSLAQLVAGLAGHEAAGLALAGRLDDAEVRAAQVAADRAGLPLLRLPATAHLSEVEHLITALIRERRDALYARTTALHDLQVQLPDLAGAGRALHAITDTLAQLTGRPAGFAQLAAPPDLTYLALPSGAPSHLRSTLRQAWTDGAEPITENLAPAGGSAPGISLAEPPVYCWPIPGSEPTPTAASSDPPSARYTLLAAPAIVQEQLVATLVLLVEGPVSGLDQLTLARGAATAARELARERLARRHRPEEVPADGVAVFRLLLAGAGGSEEDLRVQAQTVGLPLARGYAVALVTTGAPGVTPSSRALEELARTGPAQTAAPGTWWRIVDGRLVILWPLEGSAPAEQDRVVPAPERLRATADTARAEVARRTGNAATAGLGRGHSGLLGIGRSAQEAEQAVTLGSRLFGGGAVWSYEELGVYHLLLPLRAQHATELRTFLADTLGPLAADRRAGSRALLETLDVYLAHGGNASQAATALHLHRNTLAYRLRRISQITGLDVDEPEARLQLHLALKVRHLL